MASNYLVTGGAGFIGSHFAKMVLEKEPGSKVVVLDKLAYSGNLENLKSLEKNKDYSFIKGDICDAKVVAKAMKDIDVVVNFAAEAAVDRSISGPSVFIQTDVFGAFTLLEESRKSGVKKFFQISTDEVYGQVLEGSFKETDALMPRSPYAASKAAADRLAYSYFTTYGLEVFISRSCNNYGTFAFPEKMFALFITNILEGKKIPVYGDGKNTREYIHVLDHCNAIDFLLKNGKPGEVYNIGSGVEKNILEVSDIIIKELGASRDVLNFVQDRPGHDKRYSVDISKIQALGWKPRIDFDKGFAETVQWYKNNPKYWIPLKKKLDDFSKGFWQKKELKK